MIRTAPRRPRCVGRGDRARAGQPAGREMQFRQVCRRTRHYVERVHLSAYGGVVPVVGQVNVTPTTRGLPGGDLAQQLLDWLAQGALWGCLAALLIGGLVWGLSARAGNSMQAGTGRTFAIGGAVGALIAGLAPTIVNTFFNEAQ